MAIRCLVCLLVLCALLFLACYLGTGDDRRNMRSFWSYPVAVQEVVRQDPQLVGMVPPKRPAVVTFLANLALFSAVLAVVGLVIPADGFSQTFLALLAVGEGLNLFDLLVVDLLWWRNSPRVRLGGVGDPSLYRDARPHVAAFLRGVPLFAVAALVASLVSAV